MSELQMIDTIPALPPRPANGHKGTFGTVIVVGGCQTMIGAPAFSASAALRVGAGLAKVACDVDILTAVLAVEPCATGLLLRPDPAGLLALLDHADPKHAAVLAVGPGMGTSDDAATRVAAALSGSRTVVLDADGLNHLAKTGPVPNRRCGLVMTPHPGEYARLAHAVGIEYDTSDHNQRVNAAAELAATYNAVVVLKGSQTVVSDGYVGYINQTGNPALATAGSGDVLTGVVAGLVAQGLTPIDAAILGVHLHGLAADGWAVDYGPSGLTARDLVDLIPHAMHSHRARTDRMGRGG